MTPLEEQYLLKPTNRETLKTRQSLISVGRVVGGGIATQGTSTTSALNPLLGSKDVISVNEMFPHNLRDEVQTLVEFLRQYYISENASDLSGISAIFNTLYEKRDVDLIDVEDLRVMEVWFREFAKTFSSSKELKIDPRTFLKHVQKLYQEKGSQNGIQSFFRLLYNADTDVYLPWEDVLIASDGKWDDTNQGRIALDEYTSELKGFTLGKGEFTTNDGFLSDRIYLQDSYYYQQYSYDIRSQIPEQDWMSLFKILLHPAGFIVFSTLILAIFSNTGRMPRSQAFGFIESLAHRIILLIESAVSMKKIQEVFVYMFQLSPVIFNRDYFSEDTFLRYTFYSGTTIEAYPSEISIEQLQHSTTFNTGSLITQVPLDLREWLTADGNYFATADGVNFGVPA